MNYINKITLFGLVILASFANAQVGSPYSQFSYGDQASLGFERSKAMGGIGIGMQSNQYLNNANPASYIALDSLSTLYSLGFNTGFNNIESSVDNIQKNDTRFGYFTLGFKGNKYWASSFGLLSHSKVDYTYMLSESNGVNGVYNYIYHGNGGLNKFYWSNAFRATKDLSLGVNVSYIFGAINRVTSVFFEEEYDTRNYTSDVTKVKRKLNVSDFTFDLGMQYSLDINEKSSMVLGGVYQIKSELKAKKGVIGGTISSSSIGENDLDGFYKDFYNTEASGGAGFIVVDTSGIESSIEFPHAIGVGFTYSYKNKMVAGIDVKKELWGQINNDLYNASYQDQMSVRGGIEYTPDANSPNYYFKRLHYRFGGHFTQTNLKIKNTSINDYGISFGVGLPLRNTKTSFNLSAEFGQRGTLDQNLLKESYGIISLNISLSDIWFVKRKFK